MNQKETRENKRLHQILQRNHPYQKLVDASARLAGDKPAVDVPQPRTTHTEAEMRREADKIAHALVPLAYETGKDGRNWETLTRLLGAFEKIHAGKAYLVSTRDMELITHVANEDGTNLGSLPQRTSLPNPELLKPGEMARARLSTRKDAFTEVFLDSEAVMDVVDAIKSFVNRFPEYLVQAYNQNGPIQERADTVLEHIRLLPEESRKPLSSFLESWVPLLNEISDGGIGNLKSNQARQALELARAIPKDAAAPAVLDELKSFVRGNRRMLREAAEWEGATEPDRPGRGGGRGN